MQTRGHGTHLAPGMGKQYLVQMLRESEASRHSGQSARTFRALDAGPRVARRVTKIFKPASGRSSADKIANGWVLLERSPGWRYGYGSLWQGYTRARHRGGTDLSVLHQLQQLQNLMKFIRPVKALYCKTNGQAVLRVRPGRAAASDFISFLL